MGFPILLNIKLLQWKFNLIQIFKIKYVTELNNLDYNLVKRIIRNINYTEITLSCISLISIILLIPLYYYHRNRKVAIIRSLETYCQEVNYQLRDLQNSTIVFLSLMVTTDNLSTNSTSVMNIKLLSTKKQRRNAKLFLRLVILPKEIAQGELYESDIISRNLNDQNKVIDHEE